MITEGTLDTSHIKIIVLDEMDVMLSKGFEDEVREIFREIHSDDLQTIAVTATLPAEVLQVRPCRNFPGN